MSRRPLPELPIDEVLPSLVEALRGSRSVVLKAPPGAGKSTRVPGAVLDAGLAGAGTVLMLEPRRIAARATAKRIAEERGARLGGEVGYQVRFDERRSGETRVLIVTEGILTRRLARDPLIEDVGCLILDEFHERSVHTDLSLAFARELLEVRDDLRLVVMSATLETGPLSQYLGGCPVVTCEARTFPLDVRYAEGRDERPLEARVRSALFELVRRDDDDGGDLLVFLPGAGEIRRAQATLEEHPLPGGIDVVPLYGALSAEEQDRALAKGARRRVVLATNIAETSLTVEGVTTVVDSGLEKRLRQSPRTGLDELEQGFVSKESAEQRAGRAGRTKPGRAVRLWTKVEHARLPDRREPELARVDLAPVLLSVLAFHPGDPRAFPFFEPPPEASVEVAVALLERLSAVREVEGVLRLTKRGERFLELPLHPRLAALLLRARDEGGLKDGATFAALLEERDLLRREALAEGQRATEASDLALRKDLLEAVEAEGFSFGAARALGLDARAARQVAASRDQLLSLFPRSERRGGLEDERAHARMLLAAFPDRVCRRSEPGAREGRMVGGRGVELARESVVRAGELFVAAVVEGRRGASRSLVRMAVELTAEDLEATYPEQLVSDEGARFDEERRAVVGVRARRFADLPLEERSGVRVAPEVLAAVLAEEATRRRDEVFRPDEAARRLLARLRFAKRVLPEEPWPDLEDAWIDARLEELCEGKRSFDELSRVDWAQQIHAAVPWELLRLLDEEVPDKLEVPSGSRIAVDYDAAFGPEEAPVLAVKLQEVFGLAETPRVARGRVPLLLHLLGPNFRPVQVTRDLRSFWDGAYVEVRKELRRRYPKHAWPEDPWSAPPEARPRRRR